MSLIDRLGGYGKAKDIITQNIKDFEEAVDEVGIYHPSSGWIVHEDLVKELLEYRRQHNIFEVGDKVIGSKLFDDRIFEFQYYLPELSMAVISKDGAAIGLNQLRHATDAEIDANRRLDL